MNPVVLPFLFLCLMVPAARAGQPSPTVMFHASFDDTLDAVGVRGMVKPLAVEGKVEYRDGKVGRALLCGGDGAMLKYSIEGNVRASEGTVEMWVQAVDWPADEQAFHVFFETEGPGWLLLYKFCEGGLAMLSGLDNEHYGTAWQRDFVFKNGEWRHLAGVWKKDRLALFVDGVLKKVNGGPPLSQNLGSLFRVGDYPWTTPHASHTLVDELKVHRYALTDDQVALAAQGKPLTYQPPVGLSIEPHPTQGKWKVTLDGGGYVGDKRPGSEAIVEVWSEGKVTATGRVTKFKDGSGDVLLGVSDVPPGRCLVKATLVDSKGKEVTRTEMPFEKPKKAPWMNNEMGMKDRVLPPFTEILVDGRKTGVSGGEKNSQTHSVECWGRKYDMGALFPRQIESAAQPMLAAPIQMTASIESEEVVFEKSKGGVVCGSSTRAQCEGSASVPGLDLKVETSIEYDGFLWTEMTLTPSRPCTMNDLTLRIPVRAANAGYYHHFQPHWAKRSGVDIGVFPKDGFEAAEFQPYMWVGDDERGLAWFSETQEGWSIAPGKTNQRIVRNGDVVEMEIHFINQPTQMSRPLKLSFGLQATPVKPRPANARSWRLAEMGPKGTGVPLSDMSPNRGNISIVWGSGHPSAGDLAYYGYPWPKEPAKFRQYVSDLHAKKILVVPYVNLNYMSTGAPEFDYYSPEWSDLGRNYSAVGDVAAMGHSIVGACPHSAAWRDFIAYKVAKFADEFSVDGIYVDEWVPHQCQVEGHGCAWRDARGTLHGRYPIRGYREIMRRVREIFTERRPNFHLIAHVSGAVCIPQLSFADSMLGGEGYVPAESDPKNSDYLECVTLDKLRAEFGPQWGCVPFFLPEFAGEGRVKPQATARLMGIMLALDIGPWPVWCQPDAIFDAWKKMDRFGTTEAEFLPYWKPNGIASDHKDCVVSVYRKAGSAMLVVLNTGKVDAQAILKVDPTTLGLPAEFTAKNLNDRSVLEVSGGAFKLNIPARDHRIVVLQ